MKLIVATERLVEQVTRRVVVLGLGVVEKLGAEMNSLLGRPVSRPRLPVNRDLLDEAAGNELVKVAVDVG